MRLNCALPAGVAFGLAVCLVEAHTAPTISSVMSCHAYNHGAMISSNAATPIVETAPPSQRRSSLVTANYAPIVTTQPADQTVVPGGTATFIAAAVGDPPCANNH